jgi:hypothetical protein
MPIRPLKLTHVRWREPLLALALGLPAASCADVEESEGGYLEDAELETLGEATQALSAQQVCRLGTMLPLPRVGATASSVESPALAPGFAIDNDPNTRWSSAFSDPQWLRIDLGAVRFIDTITLLWETASSQKFDLEVSHDGVSWKVVKVVAYNTPVAGPQEISYPGLNARGRFVRVSSHLRNTQWGVSLYDVSVAGDPNGGCTQPGAVRLDAVHSGLALDVDDWGTQDGAAIIQWPYHGGNNQKWVLNHTGGGIYEIRNVHSGKCLGVADSSSADRAPLQQWTCHFGTNQRFTLRAAGEGRYQIVAQHSGKCLDVEAGSTAGAARVIQWPCHDGDNQKWAVIDPLDTDTDSNNCGRAGHSCLGGACVQGVCQPALVSNAFQCATAMTATEQHVYVGDVGNLVRYDLSGYNRTTLLAQTQADYIGELAHSEDQLFFRNASTVQRLTFGQTTPTTLVNLGLFQLGLNQSSLIGFDGNGQRFVSVDRDASAPAPGTTVADLTGQYPMYSAKTDDHLYYVSGTSEGTYLHQVDLRSGQRRVLNAPSESIFGITSFGDTVYWSYRTVEGQSGIRRFSSRAGAQVEEAVLPIQAPGGIGIPLVDASGIYHTYYEGTPGATNHYYRTPHHDINQRQLVTTGGSPYSPTNAVLLADSIVWMSTCHRYGGGWLYRLAKP